METKNNVPTTWTQSKGWYDGEKRQSDGIFILQLAHDDVEQSDANHGYWKAATRRREFPDSLYVISGLFDHSDTLARSIHASRF